MGRAGDVTQSGESGRDRRKGRRRAPKQYDRMTEAEIRKVKRRQYLRLKNQFEVFWNGSVFLPGDVSQATNTLQAYAVKWMETMDNHFGIDPDGKCKIYRSGSSTTDSL